MNNYGKPRYPIYVISKGRADTQLTARLLLRMNVDFKVVIEPQDFESYKKYIDEKYLIILPFSNLDQGSIPVRNWVWQDSIDKGFDRHWVIDDNIYTIYRLHKNVEYHVATSKIFNVIEDFTDRYENIGISGLNYTSFVKKTSRCNPIRLNARIYSCSLINNNLPFRWRGRYNEDTDLSLRVLKSKRCTILFNLYNIDKTTTMKMKGGNTDNVYIDNDNRMKFAKSLQKQHPDVVKVVQRYGRWHHLVNYKPFIHNKPILKKGIEIKKGIDNYGMEFIKTNDVKSYLKNKNKNK